ncbi:hypothetical protein GCM10009736_74930 [Actinomadura bangladeshensis]
MQGTFAQDGFGGGPQHGAIRLLGAVDADDDRLGHRVLLQLSIPFFQALCRSRATLGAKVPVRTAFVPGATESAAPGNGGAGWEV